MGMEHGTNHFTMWSHGTCLGTRSDSCSEYDGEDACEKALGCAWDGGSCGGEVTACTDDTMQGSLALELTADEKVAGMSRNRRFINRWPDCDRQPGCTWQPLMCSKRTYMPQIVTGFENWARRWMMFCTEEGFTFGSAVDAPSGCATPRKFGPYGQLMPADAGVPRGTCNAETKECSV